jgi:hypothetical protein
MSTALVITIQYTRFNNLKLNGCYNDGNNFINTIKKINPNTNFIIMRDDLAIGSSLYPSRANILREFRKLINSSSSNLYFYYSGHGTSIMDNNKDEQTINSSTNGKNISRIQSLLKDSCIVSNDVNKINVISDDELFNIVVNLRANQKLYGFLDSCNSGTGMDLPWVNLGNFNTNFSSNSLNDLLNETKNKCTITSANYPDKVNKIKGHVILFSGTRDNSYSYEINQNNQAFGLFTNKLCWLINQNIENLTLRQFYLCLIGLINNPRQIPVLTLSKNISLDTNKMINFKLANTNLQTNLNQKVVPANKKLYLFYLLKSKK